MAKRVKVILICGLVAMVCGSLIPATSAQAAWPHPAPHGQFDAAGRCDGYTMTDRGLWHFSGLLNSSLRGGDTFKLRFMAHTVGGGRAWTGWYGPYSVPQAPSFRWVPLNSVFSIKRGLWTAVYMELHSSRTGKVYGDWLKQDRGDLSEVSSDGLYCRPLG